MIPVWWASFGLDLALFAGILACLELGYRVGERGLRKGTELGSEGVSAINGAILSLLGLLLAFSFAGATSRFEERRQLIVDEANAISTAYQRVDLLPASDQPEMRQLFREYLVARIEGLRSIPDPVGEGRELARAAQMQEKMWSRALAASHSDATQNVARILLPALNQMSDLATARMVARSNHMPGLLFLLVVVVALMSGFLAGHAMAKRKRRSWPHMVAFSAIIAFTIMVIFDFNYPRYGLIRVDAADKALLQVRDSMNQ
jgi:Protein of unknown function (DUF4239)